MAIKFVCNSCGARIREEDFANHCPMCKRKSAEFDKTDEPDPSEDDHRYSKKYKEVVKKLEEYTDGCEPLSPEEYED